MSWWIARCKKSGRCPEWSSYATAPRKVVRIWGMLANGKLYVTVVPAKGVMPIKKCAPTIQKECPKWIKDAFWKGCSAYLVQAHERCLWNDKCKDANKKAGTSARPADWLAGRLAGWLLSTGYPLDLEARPVVGAAAILRI